MTNLHIRQQQAVTDPLQRERLLRALKIILDPWEKTNASNPGSLVFSGVVNYIENNKLKTVLVASC